jgi:hypothetical protein
MNRVRVGLIVAVVGVGVALEAQTPADATRFAHERPIITTGTGPQRLAIDASLLGASARFRVERQGDTPVAMDGLADLRLFDQAGSGVPYLLVQPSTGEREWVTGALLGVAATKKTSGFEVDCGEGEPIDMIRVQGLPAPYLKRLTLEGSGDRSRWTLLVSEGTLFDLPDENLRQDSLGFEAGSYRYVRVTWNDTNTGRVPVPRSVFARRASRMPPPPATTIETTFERRPSEPGISRYRVRLPAGRLPIVALDLEIGGGHVYRRATVTEAQFLANEAVPTLLGSAMLSRITRDGATAAALRVPIVPPTEAEIELAIEDGANPPLDLKHVSTVLAQLPWIYFEAPAGPVLARYGNPALQRPVYDLEAVRGAIDLSKLPEANWGPARALVEDAPVADPSPLPNAGATLDPALFKYSRLIPSQDAGLLALALDVHALTHSRGPALRFADVRLLETSNRQVPYLIERRNEPLSVDLAFKPAASVRAAELKPTGGRQRSVYSLTLPAAAMPESTLVLETSGRVFQRTVRVGIDRGPDRLRRDAWFEVKGGSTWRHADDQTPARPLTLTVSTLPETELLVVVDEGDNAPLPITAARLLLPSYRLRFYYHDPSSLRLAYGRDDLQAPQYDLALLAPRVMGAPAREIAAAPPSSPGPEPQSFVPPARTFWIVVSGAVLVLLVLIARLLRAEQPKIG